MADVFICYCREDEAYLKRLLLTLKGYDLTLCDTCWSDQRINPGQKWRPELQGALASARLGILMVTPGFLASDFIKQHELPVLLERAAAGTLTLVPIPVRPVDWEAQAFSKYQSLLDPKDPLYKLKGAARDAAYVEIGQFIVAQLGHARAAALAPTAPSPGHDRLVEAEARRQQQQGQFMVLGQATKEMEQRQAVQGRQEAPAGAVAMPREMRSEMDALGSPDAQSAPEEPPQPPPSAQKAPWSDRRFWAWTALCVLACAGWLWSQRPRPFPLNQPGILIVPFAGDAQDETRTLVAAVLASQPNPYVQNHLQLAEPPTQAALTQLARKYRAALAVGGARLPESRLALTLARPYGPCRTFILANSDEALIAAHVQAAVATPPPGAWTALLLTAEHFQEPTPERSGANAAGAALSAALLRLGWNRDQVRHFPDVRFSDLAGALGRLKIRAAPGQRFLCYFKGHVMTQNGKVFLCPSDLDGRAPECSAWSLEQLVAELGKLTGEVVLVVDGALDPPARVPDNLTLLVAGHLLHPLGDDGQVGFTPLLIEGLSGTADRNGDGALTLHEWHSHLEPVAELLQKPWVSTRDPYLFEMPQGATP